MHWEEDKQAKLARCSNLKHTFQRTARDCPDVKFLLLEVCQPGEVLHVRYSVSHAHLMPNKALRVHSVSAGYSYQKCCFERSMLQMYFLHCRDVMLQALLLAELAGDIEQLQKRGGSFLNPSYAGWCLAACRRTQMRGRRPATSWAWTCCQRCSSGAARRSCGSTGASCTWSRTWAKARPPLCSVLRILFGVKGQGAVGAPRHPAPGPGPGRRRGPEV